MATNAIRTAGPDPRKNEFLIMDHMRADLDSILQGRPDAVVRWFNTVFLNQYKGEKPSLQMPRGYTGRTREATSPFDGARVTVYETTEGTWVPMPPRNVREQLKSKIGIKKRKRPATDEERKLAHYTDLYALRSPVVVSNKEIEGEYTIPFSDLTDDMLKALRNGAEIIALYVPSQHTPIISHFADFLTMYHGKHPAKDLSRISVAQIVGMVVEWDKELARQKELEALKAGTHELHTASNGCKVFLLHSVQAVEREGQRLGNCLNSNAKHYLDNSGAVVIVRNEEGSTLAAAQLIVKLRADGEKLVQCIEQRQFYGRSNTAVPADAELAMTEAAVALDWRSCADPSKPWVPASSTSRQNRDDYEEADEEYDEGEYEDGTEDDGEDEEARPARRPAYKRVDEEEEKDEEFDDDYDGL